MLYAQTRICPKEWDAFNSLDFEILTDHLIPARRPNKRVMVILIVLGAFGTVSKWVEKRVEESKPSKLLHWWDQPEYSDESRRSEETYCYSDSSESPPANASVKNTQELLSKFNLSYNSSWITFPTQTCLLCNSFCTRLLFSLIMKLIVPSLSPHN